MPIIGNTAVTLTDFATNLAPDGSIMESIQMLANSHEVVDDMTWMEGNLPTGHRYTVQTSIPQASFRLFNQGVPIIKSTEAQMTADAAMLEAYARLDRDLANLGGNASALRLTKKRSAMEGITQQFATQLFYGSVAGNPAGFAGLSSYYFTVNTATTPTAKYVIDAGGTASANTSIWLVGWSDSTITGIYPKGMTPGLQSEDVSTVAPIADANGGLYQAYQDKYSWKCGLAVMDYRYAIRICNIDTSTSAGGLQSTTPPNLQRLMIRALGKVPNFKTGKFAWYGNRAVKTWMDIQQAEKTTLAFTNVKDAQGQEFIGFRNIPFKLCDQLLNTEDRVV